MQACLYSSEHATSHLNTIYIDSNVQNHRYARVVSKQTRRLNITCKNVQPIRSSMAKFKKAVHRELESIVKVLSDPKMLPHLFEYITGMQRFAEQYRDLSYSHPDNGWETESRVRRLLPHLCPFPSPSLHRSSLFVWLPFSFSCYIFISFFLFFLFIYLSYITSAYTHLTLYCHIVSDSHITILPGHCRHITFHTSH